VFKYENYKKGKKLDKAFLIKSVIYYFLDNNLVLDNKSNEKYLGMQPYISKLKEYVDKTYFTGEKNIYSIEPPFSIQKICIMSEIIGKTCGEWYSDFDLPKIFNYINNGFNVFPNIKIEHFNTNVDISKIIESCFVEISKEKECDKYIILKDKKYIFEKMGIIFISIRLGLNNISNEYFPNIKRIFNCKEFLGFIGGKPRAASYFFGYVDDEFLFLDPHYNQTSVKDLEKEGIYSYMDKTIYKLPMTSLQTALTLGFLFRNIDEFIDLMEFYSSLSKENNPIFFISNIKDLDLIRKE
jgi:cysteine protease ATG4